MRRAALIAVVLGTAAPAAAYVRTTTDKSAPIRWPASCITLNGRSQTAPPPLTPAAFSAALRAATATWSHAAVPCTSLDLQVVEQPGKVLAANDASRNVLFLTLDWSYEPSALAITTVFATQTGGRILDADIELNGSRWQWGDLTAGAAGANVVDLQNTLTHELGHLVGLDHTCVLAGAFRRPVDHLGQPVPDCDQATPAQKEATLFPATSRGDVERRSLSPDDIEGVCAIYPGASFPDCPVDTPDAGTDAQPGEPASDAARVTDAAAVADTGVASDTAPVADVAPGPDSAQPTTEQPPPDSGCSCTAGAPSPGGGWFALSAAVLVLALARRRARITS